MMKFNQFILKYRQDTDVEDLRKGKLRNYIK